MEFQHEVLRLEGELAAYTSALLTPGSGPKRALATILEELDEQVDPLRPPRWLLLQEDDGMELLVHLAEPMFAAQGYDADEYMDDALDEFVYLGADGDAFLRSGDKEFDVDDPDVDEITAYLCASHDLLADFVWFGPVPELLVFRMMMEDAEQAYRGALPTYRKR